MHPENALTKVAGAERGTSGCYGSARSISIAF
jgi:hypothetical protein